MNEKERSEIIRMANEAGLCDSIWIDEESSTVNSVIYFAQLVAANAAATLIEQGYRKCAEGQHTTQFCGMLEQAVKAEREACAKMCDELQDVPATEPRHCAQDIRLRGQQ